MGRAIHRYDDTRKITLHFCPDCRHELLRRSCGFVCPKCPDGPLYPLEGFPDQTPTFVLEAKREKKRKDDKARMDRERAIRRGEGPELELPFRRD